MSGKLAMLRLYGGEYVMGELDESYSDSLIYVRLLNPRTFRFSPSYDGSVRAAFMPISMLDEKKTESTLIHRTQVWLTIPEENLPADVVNGYRSEISGIRIAKDVPGPM